VNDAERPQSFVEAQELSAHISRAYEECGFQLVELVRSSVADRRRQVLDYSMRIGTRPTMGELTFITGPCVVARVNVPSS